MSGSKKHCLSVMHCLYRTSVAVYKAANPLSFYLFDEKGNQERNNEECVMYFQLRLPEKINRANENIPSVRERE
jgi:hypothetical protein